MTRKSEAAAALEPPERAGWTFGPLRREALDQMAALEKQCFSLPWSRQALEEELDRPDAPYVVCTGENGAVLGYIGCRVALDEGEITNVAVAPALRRQGLGAELLRRTLALLRERGVTRVFLEVRESNLAAQALYARAGFAPIGRRRRYYAKPEEDALLFGRELI